MADPAVVKAAPPPWLANALDAPKTMPADARPTHFFSLVENEIHHGAGLSGLHAVTQALVHYADEIAASFSAPVVEALKPLTLAEESRREALTAQPTRTPAEVTELAGLQARANANR